MSRDGTGTRQNILEAAVEIFPRQGYRRTTVADICRRAGANIAAVNYHFKSKKELYRAVWLHLMELAQTRYPVAGGLPETAPPEERLKAHIRTLIDRRVDRGEVGRLHGLFMMEMVNPTGVLDEQLTGRIMEQRRRVFKIISQLLGPKADERLIGMCEMSLFSQCRMVRPEGHPPQKPLLSNPYRLHGEEMAPGDKERLIDFIYQVSLAGLASLRQSLENSGEALQ